MIFLFKGLKFLYLHRRGSNKGEKGSGGVRLCVHPLLCLYMYLHVNSFYWLCDILIENLRLPLIGKPRIFFPRFWVFSYIFLFNFWNRRLLKNKILWFVDWWFILLDFTVNFWFFLILASQIFCFLVRKFFFWGWGRRGW